MADNITLGLVGIDHQQVPYLLQTPQRRLYRNDVLPLLAVADSRPDLTKSGYVRQIKSREGHLYVQVIARSRLLGVADHSPLSSACERPSRTLGKDRQRSGR
jgi:hypothetical protein